MYPGSTYNLGSMPSALKPKTLLGSLAMSVVLVGVIGVGIAVMRITAPLRSRQKSSVSRH